VDDRTPEYADPGLKADDVVTLDLLRSDPATGRTARETVTVLRRDWCSGWRGGHLFTRLLSPGLMVCVRCREVRPAT
jgi:hypothetical protein